MPTSPDSGRADASRTADQTDTARPATTSDDPWAPAAVIAPVPERAGRRPLAVFAIALFAIGVILTIAAAVVPFILGHDAPTLLYLGAMFFTPAGFVLALVAAITTDRRS